MFAVFSTSLASDAMAPCLSSVGVLEGERRFGADVFSYSAHGR